MRQRLCGAWCGAILSLSLLAALPAAVGAQTVRGRVLEFHANTPVASATVQLLEGQTGDKVVVSATADDSGHFELRAPASGVYRIRSARLGYKPVVTAAFDLVRRGAALEVEVRMSPLAVPLAPLTIVAGRRPWLRSRRLWEVGFYGREEAYGRTGLGSGQFLDAQAIRYTNPFHVADVVRMLRGVWVVPTGGTTESITMLGHRGARFCRPELYVDGFRLLPGESVEEVVSPWELAGVEVYVGMGMPAQFMSVNAWDCGAIALWTGADESDGSAAGAATAADTLAASAPLAVDIALVADRLSLPDTLFMRVTIRNRSDSTIALCVESARYRLRGKGTDRQIMSQVDDGRCGKVLMLVPGGSSSWQDRVLLSRALPDGLLVVQETVDVRYRPCDTGAECRIALRSGLRPITLLKD